MTSQVPLDFCVVNWSDYTQLSLAGADRVKFLQGFCTNDVKLLTPGSGCEAFITNHQGKTIGHVVICCEADRLVLHTVQQQAEKLHKHFDRFIITEDVVITDITPTVTQWLVVGQELEAKLTPAGVALPSELWEFVTIKLNGLTLTICRVPFAGPSFLITAAKEDQPALMQQLQAWQIPELQDQAQLAGMRIEGNWPEFGSDITDDNLPQEIDRDQQAISFKKGCYLGQETVARLDALGHVNKILTRVKWQRNADEGTIPPSGTELMHDGKAVGRITSTGFLPAQNCCVAFAIVRVAQAKAGTKLMLQEMQLEVEVMAK